MAVLERRFLFRRLPAWHRNTAKRLIKAPRIHLLDTGLAATLSDLKGDDWLEKRDLMGHVLESFVVQQLMAQAGWTDLDLRFWHYRDKDQVEVDVVITRGRQTWGVEVKAVSTIKSKHVQGLSRLAEKCGTDFKQGILLYGGNDIFPMYDKHLLAVPIWSCGSAETKQTTYPWKP